MRISDIISILYGCGINFLWYIYNRPFYLNNIISIFLIGTVMKLFKITSFKNSVILFVLLLFFESGGALFIYQYNASN